MWCKRSLSLRDHSAERGSRRFPKSNEIGCLADDHSGNVCVVSYLCGLETSLLRREVSRETVDVRAPLPSEGITHRAKVPTGRPIETARDVEHGTTLGIATAAADGDSLGVIAGEGFVTSKECGSAQHTRSAERQRRG
jgi:hypothetical protein